MQSPSRVFGRIVLGIYNILSTYLLGWVLVLGCLAFGLHLLTELIVAPFGFERADQWWEYAAWRLDMDALILRLVVYLSVHGAILYFARPLWGGVQAFAESCFEAVATQIRRVTRSHSRLYIFIRAMFTVGVTVVLIPFVIQPTLVGGGLSTADWLARTVNLVDGTASRNVVDSVAGAYRRFVVDDVESHGGVDESDLTEGGLTEGDLTGETLDESTEEPDGKETTDGDGADPATPPPPSGREPLMDRWDAEIRAATNGDAELFAFVKAFMRVESSGRQFAVSRTGCAGLMQFCSGTARRQPFRRIFGAGSVYSCGCHPNCDTPQRVTEALETGNRDAIDDLSDRFPCDLSDARFDGTKSIRAGTRYIEDLADSYGGNLYLMYVGYNSGPGVANTVWRRVGRDADAGLDCISPHLADALRPHFHGASNRRARSLLDTHLPRLRRAYDQYYQPPSDSAQAVAIETGF